MGYITVNTSIDGIERDSIERKIGYDRDYLHATKSELQSIILPAMAALTTSDVNINSRTIDCDILDAIYDATGGATADLETEAAKTQQRISRNEGLLYDIVWTD